MLEPSHEIKDEYIFYTFVLDDKTEVYGRIAIDDGTALHVVQNLLTPDDVLVIPRNRIKEQTRSTLSAMPTGLLVILTSEEILDLVAYLESSHK